MTTKMKKLVKFAVPLLCAGLIMCGAAFIGSAQSEKGGENAENTVISPENQGGKIRPNYGVTILEKYIYTENNVPHYVIICGEIDYLTQKVIESKEIFYTLKTGDNIFLDEYDYTLIFDNYKQHFEDGNIVNYK